MLSRIVPLFALALALAAPAAGVAGAQQSSYPNVDKPIAIGAGETVQLLNRVVNEGGPSLRPTGRRLDLQYSTSIPAGDSAARQAQADRAAQFFGPEAIELGVRKLSIGICDTRACAERRDPPAVWYMYERASSGWKRSRQ